MTAIVEIILGLLAVMVLVAVIAQRLQIAPSILLVVAGIALALIPGLPPIELAPIKRRGDFGGGLSNVLSSPELTFFLGAVLTFGAPTP